MTKDGTEVMIRWIKEVADILDKSPPCVDTDSSSESEYDRYDLAKLLFDTNNDTDVKSKEYPKVDNTSEYDDDGALGPNVRKRTRNVEDD